MRQGQQQNRRNRGRGRNNRSSNPLSRNYESNGPEVKIKGSAAHIAEKYMALARDALSSGNPVTAENYYQHAEHYNRIIQAAQAKQEEQAATKAAQPAVTKPVRNNNERPPRRRNESGDVQVKNAEPEIPGIGKQPKINGNGAENDPVAAKPKRKPRVSKPKATKVEASDGSDAKPEDDQSKPAV